MTPVTVTLSCSREALDPTVEQAQAQGLQIDRVHRNLRVVTGEIDPNRIAALRAVNGIDTVETAHKFEVPTPDTPVQ